MAAITRFQSAGAIPLVLVGMIAQFAQPIEEHHPCLASPLGCWGSTERNVELSITRDQPCKSEEHYRITTHPKHFCRSDI
jgi:hypothetical protein